MGANPYESPTTESIRSIDTPRWRWIAFAIVGTGFFLMPTWITLLQHCHPDPNWTMKNQPDNFFGRISLMVGGSTTFVFTIPLAGSAAAVLLSPLSRSRKKAVLVALFPLYIVQCLAITFALVLCCGLSV